MAALILAAGRGSRFGSDKRHARLPDGRTMLEAVVQAQCAVCRPVLVVLRPDDDEALAARVREMGAQPLVCPDAGQGMGRSLAFGMAAIAAQPQVRAVLIALADMPWIGPVTLSALCEAVVLHERPVLPVHQGQPGQPRALPRACFDRLLGLQGDEGARRVIDWAQEGVAIEVDDPGVLADVDRPEHLARGRPAAW